MVKGPASLREGRTKLPAGDDDKTAGIRPRFSALVNEQHAAPGPCLLAFARARQAEIHATLVVGFLRGVDVEL